MPAPEPVETMEPKNHLSPEVYVEIEDLDESDLADPAASELSYFGTDFDVLGLVRRLNRGDIQIPTFSPDVTGGAASVSGFQRDFVWTKLQQDRFIESLLLGYPVPGIFLVEEENKILLVLDGQQRLTTLRNFYDQDRGFSLSNVAEEFRGLTYDHLDPDRRRALDNTFIHATIVRYDPNREAEAVYQLFERLNTGGTELQSHEIRVAIFNGELVRWIRDLNENASWRALAGQPSRRLKDQELILRFFALLHRRGEYSRPLKRFLNEYTSDHQSMDTLDRDGLERLFSSTVDFILETWGERAFRISRLVNAAVAESLMVAVADRLDQLVDADRDCLRRARQELLESTEYLTAVTRSTSDEERVRDRLTRAEHMVEGCL